MKFKLNLLALILVAFVICVPLSGCGTTAQRASFQTASGTAVTVEVGLAAYNQFAKAGKTTLNQNLKVKEAFEKYKLAMATACDAGAIYAASNTTNAPAAAAYQQAMLNGAQSITDFLNLVQSFGVKLTN